jgi:RNA polymerase sigma factor (sigma-70 family)
VDGYLICRGKKAHRRQVRRLCSVEGGVTNRGIARILDFLRHEVVPGPDLLPDAELLRRYHATRDEAAFELLVRRHGPMVWGVARRVLRDEHAAEDAFQATFLALARKAKSLRRYDALAGWLYRSALRIAFRARGKTQVAIAPVGEPPAPPEEWSDLKAVLDEEVDRLPERYRMPVVLCYLSGRTTEEAARQLGCPRGTVLSRLRTARERLRIRLTRRGYGVPAATVAAVLAAETAPAGVVGPLVALAMKSTGPATLAPGVVALTEGVFHAMWMTKATIVAATVLTAGLVGIGAAGAGGLATGSAQTSPPTIVKPDANAQADDNAAALRNQKLEEAAMIQRPSEELRRELEARYRKMLTDATRQRTSLRVRLESLEDDFKEHERERLASHKLISFYQTRRHTMQQEMFSMLGYDPEHFEYKKRRTQLKEDEAEQARLQQRDAELRKLMRPIRQEIISIEEDVKLQEQLMLLELRKLERELKN